MPARRWRRPSRSRCRAWPAICPATGAVDLDRLAAALAARPAGGADHLLSGAAACGRYRRRSTRLCAALAARGLAPAPLVVTSLKEPDAAAFIRAALRAARARRHPHHHRLRRRRRAGRADAARRAGRAGAAGRDRHHQARGLARQRARARRRRSRHARGAARARRPRARGRRSRSRTRCRRRTGSPSRRSPTGRSRTGSPSSPIASPRSRACRRRRAPSGASRS